MSVIIGIDPGASGSTGLAFCTADGTELRTLVMTAAPGPGLALLRKLLVLMIDRHGADGSMVLYETPFFNMFSPSAAGPLFRVCGVVEEFAASLGIPCVGIAPTKLRSRWGVKTNTAIKNRDARTKDGKRQMIEAMRALGHDPVDSHQADAAALVELACRAK